MTDEETDEDGEEASKDLYCLVTGSTVWEGGEGLRSEGMRDPRGEEEARPSYAMFLVV